MIGNTSPPAAITLSFRCPRGAVMTIRRSKALHRRGSDNCNHRRSQVQSHRHSTCARTQRRPNPSPCRRIRAITVHDSRPDARAPATGPRLCAAGVVGPGETRTPTAVRGVPFAPAANRTNAMKTTAMNAIAAITQSLNCVFAFLNMIVACSKFRTNCRQTTY